MQTTGWKENWIEEWSALGALQKQVFGSEELSKNAKAEVYNAMVVPMMMYGCESWVLREREKTVQAAAIRNECIKEDSRCDQAI